MHLTDQPEWRGEGPLESTREPSYYAWFWRDSSAKGFKTASIGLATNFFVKRTEHGSGSISASHDAKIVLKKKEVDKERMLDAKHFLTRQSEVMVGVVVILLKNRFVRFPMRLLWCHLRATTSRGSEVLQGIGAQKRIEKDVLSMVDRWGKQAKGKRMLSIKKAAEKEKPKSSADVLNPIQEKEPEDDPMAA